MKSKRVGNILLWLSSRVEKVRRLASINGLTAVYKQPNLTSGDGGGVIFLKHGRQFGGGGGGIIQASSPVGGEVDGILQAWSLDGAGGGGDGC